MLDRERLLAGCYRSGRRLLVGLEIEQQQGAFGEERAAAHRAQIVEQRQQHQRKIAPAGKHALKIARQLHHRPHQRIQALGLALALGGGGDEIVRDVLHLLGEERRAVDLKHAQHALHLVQLERAALEKCKVERLLDVVL